MMSKVVKLSLDHIQDKQSLKRFLLANLNDQFAKTNAYLGMWTQHRETRIFEWDEGNLSVENLSES